MPQTTIASLIGKPEDAAVEAVLREIEAAGFTNASFWGIPRFLDETAPWQGWAVNARQAAIESLRDGWDRAERIIAAYEAARVPTAGVGASIEYVGPRWVPVTERLPLPEIPVQLWGNALTPGVDYPVLGRLCSHCGALLADNWDKTVDGPCVDVDTDYTRRMLGTITHWLDWEPAP